MAIFETIFLACLVSIAHSSVYDDTHTLPDRQTAVHLFQWKWSDIANECETFLSKYKYGMVQISPPNEHLMTTMWVNGKEHMPWWIDYQPVSYKLQSRRGTVDELKDMISRCNKVGVRIVVDGVINHMTIVNQKYPGQYGVWSSAGSSFDATDRQESFPGVPYSKLDFHDPICDGNIGGGDYGNNAANVRNCRLGGLTDLDHSKDWVRQKVVDYMNSLIDLGISGFRVDAVKHMWPVDIDAMWSKLKNLDASIYGPNKRPFMVQEVSDSSGEIIRGSEYLNTGRITMFSFGNDVSAAVKREGQNFKYFNNYGPYWSYYSDNSAFVFIDNHDSQRDHRPVLTYKFGSLYTMGVTYMLAWPYGYPIVMSSFNFTSENEGAPNSGSPNWTVATPAIQSDETCSPQSGWVCEHRWPAIRRMATFRGVVSGQAPANIVNDEDNRLAFRRGNKGFFALNNQDGPWQRRFYTGLPQGSYCDVISGEYNGNGGCTGVTVKVDTNGNADIVVASRTNLAIHMEQRVPSDLPVPTPIPSTYQRTVVMIHKETAYGQNLFIRGGLDGFTHGCTGDKSAASSHCSIPIVHKTNVSDDILTYNSWSQEDAYLDWFGGEPNQGTYDGIPAEGTPLTYTTNDPSQSQYNPLNHYGKDYWLVDLLMDCTKTDNGWFSLKGFLKMSLTPSGGNELENDVKQASKCAGSVGAVTPSNVGSNHAGLCGKINVFNYGQGDCEINSF